MSIQARRGIKLQDIQSPEKFFYSSGAVANGVKTDAFTFFLLFFYSSVIGLDPRIGEFSYFYSSARRCIHRPFNGSYIR